MEKLPYELAIALLDAMDCVALTDDTGRYLYKNKMWYERRRIFGQDVDAQYPWEIFKNTGTLEVIKTHRKVTGHIMDSSGTMICTNYYPIERDGKFFGVLIWTFFTGQDSTVAFSHRLHALSQELEVTKEKARRLAKASYSIPNIIGESDAIVSLKEEIADVARTTSSVLIEGETGVGKELVAHAIHDLSRRRDERFVRVNCAAIPETLIESELFGYAPGAFTGAQRGGKVGKFELASNGSLFLDEINSLPLTVQPKLLRALQEKEIDRVGGLEPIPIDTRFLAATNCDLAAKVAAKEFREDLYYRLNVIRIRIPPLRERMSDIPLLARSLVDRLNYQMGMEIGYIDDAAIARLMSYDWPGNIRELQNVIEFAMNYAHGDTIELKHIEPYFSRGSRQREGGQSDHPSQEAALRAARFEQKSARDKAERERFLQALEACDGNRQEAAVQLGIPRSTFYRKLKKYGI